MNTNLTQIIQQYKEDKQSVYNTWFINNEERLTAFRSIRRGVMQVVGDIKCKRFPNDFKGSSLEFVLSCITEQKQVFEGASHPFFWNQNCAFLIFMRMKSTNSLLVNSLKTVSMRKQKNRS